MGAYVSKDVCLSQYNVTMDCTVSNGTSDTPPNHLIIGGLIFPHSFSSNPDIAGVGIFWAFFAVSLLAVAATLLYVLLGSWTVQFGARFRHVDQEARRAKAKLPDRITWSDIIEGVIVSCSDQQIFTSGAYCIGLRVYQGCLISAYHYNILGNMMLITCATHLMSVMIVSSYWKNKLLAGLRILLLTGLYIETAIILSNQNAAGSQWPASVPPANVTDSPMMLNAACFQSNKTQLLGTLTETFENSTDFFQRTLGDSSPGNHIVGWNFFILMILWYGLTIIAQFIQLIFYRHGKEPFSEQNRVQQVISWVIWIYQLSGTAFCMATLFKTYIYIRDLRNWMANSGWMMVNEQGANDELNATSFGQLVPLLLTLMTVFVTIGSIGDKFAERWRRNGEVEESPPMSYNPSSVVILNGKGDTTIQYTSVPRTPYLGME